MPFVPCPSCLGYFHSGSCQFGMKQTAILNPLNPESATFNPPTSIICCTNSTLPALIAPNKLVIVAVFGLINPSIPALLFNPNRFSTIISEALLVFISGLKQSSSEITVSAFMFVHERGIRVYNLGGLPIHYNVHCE
ncbi:hypothetical protein AX774_g4181 [Zancudomyces culisetae]|uniref:Uncharacterized protein n=1 Tax=Zancudomyces culisetae TaxID=1213189 RepID=A0A1R1PN04_ZANCU|nr:hypothetical protein AX774_g4181 [Zancudomyces culisetae]|eukprot:OMH82345.1 hypothetical protein AX774_g4181 [Zancudomyces culisetae]